MGFGTTPKDSSLIPLGSVYVPNHAASNLSALQGGPASTDTNGNESAPVATYVPDGNNLTLGAKADSAATDNTSAWSEIALLKAMLGKLLTSIAVTGTISATNPSVSTDGATAPTSSTQIGGSDGTNLQPLQVDGSKYLKVNIAASTTVPVSGTVTANAGTNMSTAALAQESGGNLATIATNTAGLATDGHASTTATNTTTIAGAITSNVVQSNAKQINGTTTSVNAGNRDGGTQRFIEAGNGTGTVTQVASSASSGVILAANTNKKGTLFYNDSTQILYLLYGTGTASPTNYSVKIGPQAYFEDPLHYTGGFNGIWAAANGFVYCTEVS